MISLTHFLGVCWLLNIGKLAKKFGNAYICIVYACTVYGIYAGKRHGIEQRKRFCLGCKLHKKRIQQLILVEDLGEPKGLRTLTATRQNFCFLLCSYQYTCQQASGINCLKLFQPMSPPFTKFTVPRYEENGWNHGCLASFFLGLLGPRVVSCIHGNGTFCLMQGSILFKQF